LVRDFGLCSLDLDFRLNNVAAVRSQTRDWNLKPETRSGFRMGFVVDLDQFFHRNMSIDLR
jgi:hypothetical protein